MEMWGAASACGVCTVAADGPPGALHALGPMLAHTGPRRYTGRTGQLRVAMLANNSCSANFATTSLIAMLTNTCSRATYSAHMNNFVVLTYSATFTTFSAHDFFLAVFANPRSPADFAVVSLFSMCTIRTLRFRFDALTKWWRQQQQSLFSKLFCLRNYWCCCCYCSCCLHRSFCGGSIKPDRPSLRLWRFALWRVCGFNRFLYSRLFPRLFSA